MPQQTVKELGQQVKQKYAGSYDDISDEDLGRQVKAKYPGSYDDYADAPQGHPPDSSTAGDVAKRRISDVMAGLGFPSTRTVSDAIRHPLDTGLAIAKYAGTGQLAEDALRVLAKAPYVLGKTFTESAPTAYREAEALFSTSPNYKGPPVSMPTEQEQSDAARAAGTFAATAPIVASEAALAKGALSGAAKTATVRFAPSADSAMERAAAIRAAVAKTPPASVPHSPSSAAIQVVKAATRPLGNAVSEMMENYAKALSSEDAVRFNSPPVEAPDPSTRSYPSPAATALPYGHKAPTADMAQHPPIVPFSREPFAATETKPLNIPRPAPGEIPQNTPAPPPNPAELNKWMNVQPNQLIYGNNPAEQILSDGLLGVDKAKTLENVVSARKSAGAQMEAAFKKAEAGTDPIEEIRSAMESGEHGHYGLRVIPEDQTGNFKAGDSLPSSYEWDDGVRGEGEIGGTSTIYLKNSSPQEIKRVLKEIGADDKTHGGYHGNQVALVGGDDAIGGNDIGEAIFPEGKVVRLFDKKSSGSGPGGGLKSTGVRFNIEAEINAAIADAKKVYGSGSDEAFMKSLENLQDQFVQHNGDLKSMTPSEAHTFEKDLSAGANYGSMARSDVTKFLRDLRSRVNRQLKAEVPGIAELKDKWGNLFEAEKSLKSSLRKDAVGRGSGSIPPPSLTTPIRSTRP